MGGGGGGGGMLEGGIMGKGMKERGLEADTS